MTFMFNPLHFIAKLKQAILTRLITFISAANHQAPMIKQREFLHTMDVKKLQASNDSVNCVVEPFR